MSAGFEHDQVAEAEQAAEASVPTYLKEADPHFRALLSAADAALPRLLAGRDAAAAVDKVRGAAIDLQQWMTANACPDSVLADRLQVFAARYRFVCLELERKGVDHDAARLLPVVEQLRSVNADLETLLTERR